MKNFSKAVIRAQPPDLVQFSLDYFKEKYETEELKKEKGGEQNEIVKPEETLIRQSVG